MSDDESEDLEEVLSDIRDQLEDEPELESTAPTKALDLWFQSLDRADSTIQSYRYRISPFLEWLEDEGIDDLSELSTRKIKEFEAYRRSSDLDTQSLNNQFGTIRQWLRYCHKLQAVSKDVVKALDVPSLSKEDRVNTEKLITERAEDILYGLDQYRYASREHTVFLLFWRTTARIGTIHSLDLEDYYNTDEDRERLREELANEGFAPHVIESILDDVEFPLLYPRHRPESETPLKNNEGGERVINLAEWVGDVVEDYIQVNRKDVRDGHGRRPLITSAKGDGRLSKSAMRNWTYILTQPCEFGGPCPHDRDPETCEAREHGQGSKCPSSRSPHRVRTGSITNHRDRGWPISELADRANTSEDLIEGVYDQPEQLIRGAVRREFLEKLDDK
ncbi:tyrosine-type recombinase/integrase [Halosimplex amylolyticum]|uniref:tyrosine-type recombinase/integrase n=1 Tax=Halosimplex amylolyticum TaxID=3396616 RepID=UPI003F54C1CE